MGKGADLYGWRTFRHVPYIIWGYHADRLDGAQVIANINGGNTILRATKSMLTGYGNGDDIALGCTIGYIFELIAD